MAGSIKEVALNGRTFETVADADANTDIGGVMNEWIPHGNGVTGHVSQTAKGWKVEGVGIYIDDTREDQEFIQDIADKGQPVTFLITYNDNTSRSGKGLPTGDLTTSSKNGVMTPTFEGPGKLEQQ